MKNDRLFQLLYILLEKGCTTAPDLARQLEVSVRTIYRDVEALSVAGIPVYASAGKGGGISLMPGYTFDRALLSDDEQNQILFAIQSLQVVDQKVGALLSKLGAAFQKPNQSWIEVDFSRWGFAKRDTQRFEQLKTAILQKRVLHLVYCGTSGETTQRSVHPIKLVFKDKHWYLQAFCMKAADFRLFKVSRILELEVTQQQFQQDYTGELPPLETEAPSLAATAIKLRFSPQAAFRVYDEFEPGSIQVQPDGYMQTTVSFPMDSWVVGYLFSFGCYVEVIEPAWLRQQLAEYAQKILNHYRS